MAITRIKILSSSTSGNTPTNLAPGELAINSADGKLFYLNQNNNNTNFIQNSNSFSTIIANGVSLFATTPKSILAVNPDSSNTIQFTANTLTDTFTLGVNENNIVSFVRKSGDTMTGDLHIEGANVYANNISSNTINVAGSVGIVGNLSVSGVITGPTVQSITDQANNTFELANAAYSFANSAEQFAQQAFDIANAAVREVAVTDVANTSNNAANTFFVNFTDGTNNIANSIFTNYDTLTYIPLTGKLSSNIVAANNLSVSNISTITANTVNLKNLDPTVVDSLDIYAFRSSSYMFQIENGLDSHMINMNVLNGDSLASFAVFGETFTYDSLGTFSANVGPTSVNVLFTPNYTPMTVSFMRKSMVRLGIEYPPVDVGTVAATATHFMDLGYVSMTADHTVDYGFVSQAAHTTQPNFDSQFITGSLDSGTF
jgi:hypothetical protein